MVLLSLSTPATLYVMLKMCTYVLTALVSSCISCFYRNESVSHPELLQHLM